MKTYFALVPNFPSFTVQAASRLLAEAVAAVTLDLEDLPVGSMLLEVRS